MDGLLKDSSRIQQQQVVFEQVNPTSQQDKHILVPKYILFHLKKKLRESTIKHLRV